MQKQKTQQGIIWGEHRTTEKLALCVKEKLEQDSDISQSILFVEFEQYRLSDYVETLYLKEQKAMKASV